MDQHLTDPLPLLAGEVRCQRVHELVAGDLLFFIDQLFDRSEAVRHIRDADLQAGNEIIHCTAFLNGLTATQAVLRQAGAKNIGNFPLTGNVDGVLHDDTCAGQFSDRAVPCLHEVVKGFHIPEISVILHESPAARHIDPVVHDHQKNAREIQVAHAGAAVAPFSGHGRLHAADCGITIGILSLDSFLDEGGNDDLVVVESRHAGPEL